MANLIAVAALLLPSVGPELKAEMLAFEKLQEQRAAERAKMRECWAREGLEALTMQLGVAEKECAAARAREMPDGGVPESPNAEMRRAANDALQSEPSCQEERRLRGLWKTRNSVMDGCVKHELEKMDTRRAEFLAACQKCAPRERCKKNLRENELTINGRLLLQESPELFSPAEKAEVAREKPVYACQE